MSIKTMFNVTRTSDGRYRIHGVKDYTLILDNKYDAEHHAEYLNHLYQLSEQNKDYYNTLTRIKMLTEQIQRETSELHITELAIRIKNEVKTQ